MSTERSLPAVDLRASMQRRAGRPGKIEKARNPRRALTRLALYLKPYSLSLGLVGGFVVLSSVLGLAGPYLWELQLTDSSVARTSAASCARPASCSAHMS